MPEFQGRVLWGANNIFSVESPDGTPVECRIKGKQLIVSDEYNVLVPGDVVRWEQAGSQGMIVERQPRRNVLLRWNRKQSQKQAFAANVDLACCVMSPVSPPFRPRFVDRCLVEADAAGVPMVIVLNKIDQEVSEDTRERFELWRTLGYEVHEISVLTGSGMEAFKKRLKGLTVLFMGPSGVGKTSMLNLLYPEGNSKVGKVSEKFNRGIHTTVLSRAWVVPEFGTVIDTPGVREFEPAGIDPQALAHLFRDIAPFATSCALYNCTHTDEPDCAVRRAAEESLIHFDRYESYLRLLEAVQRQDQERTDKGHSK